MVAKNFLPLGSCGELRLLACAKLYLNVAEAYLFLSFVRSLAT